MKTAMPLTMMRSASESLSWTVPIMDLLLTLAPQMRAHAETGDEGRTRAETATRGGAIPG
jgi:hypothetical protein